MKKAKYYLLLALVVFMSGCDDFLEKNPPSKPSENTFWKQKSDLDMALTACYGTMTKFSHGYFSFLVLLNGIVLLIIVIVWEKESLLMYSKGI